MIDLGGGKNPSPGRTEAASFVDIVGQAELKQALLAVAANDDLDGLLIRGEKGTAKSTAVRALRDLLPDQRVVADCPFGCHPRDRARQCADCRDRAEVPTTTRSVPLVTLPLGATRDRVLGTLSVAEALNGGHEFDPGLLARANRGFLYVDEVNLLDDHLVDVLLDAAAGGVNRVERDGVSVAHPAEFTLVGTMNPEEGDLRPQLRDRFDLCATVAACDDLDDRVAIVEQALDTDGSDEGEADLEGDADEVRERLRGARNLLEDVTVPTEFAREIAELCRDAGIDGHRGDIAAARAARTLAALDGRGKVIEPDVRRAAELALPHRLRSRPFEEAPDLSDLLDEQFDEGDDGGSDDGTDDEAAESGTQDEGGEEGRGQSGDGRDENPGPTDTDRARNGREASGDDAGGDGPSEAGSGEGSPGRGERSAGGETEPREPDAGDASASTAAVEATDGDRADDDRDDPSGPVDGTEGDPQDRTPLVPGESRATRAGVASADAPDLTVPDALGAPGGRSGDGRSRSRSADATDGPRVRTRRTESDGDVDAAASIRAASARGASAVASRDLRQSVRRTDASTLVVFAVDASASMRPAMRAAKGTVLELLKDAYRARDEVAFVAFAGDGGEVLLPPTDSVTLAARHLKELPSGDRTPLPAGLRSATEVLDRADPAAAVVVVVTDGRANVADASPVAETRRAARRLAERDPRVLVVDAGEGDDRGLTGLVAAETGGERVPLSALSADRVDAAAGAADET